uniref:Uncharacterized protein n=1 Tax=Arundo donax TaxID=35708 RepID=A0A0A9APR1_ARUDO
MAMDHEEEEEEERRMASLLAMRRALRDGVDMSWALSHALTREGSSMEEIQARLPVMEAAMRPIRAHALTAVGPNIDGAVGRCSSSATPGNGTSKPIVPHASHLSMIATTIFLPPRAAQTPHPKKVASSLFSTNSFPTALPPSYLRTQAILSLPC